MKFPQNLILDYRTKENYYLSKYWVFGFFDVNDQNFKSYSIFLAKLFYFNRSLSILSPFKNLIKLTLKKKKYIDFIIYKKKINFKKKIKISKTYKNLLKIEPKYNEFLLYRMLSKFSLLYRNNKEKNLFIFFSKNLFDLNFLRKEKMYTKLKYSRVPQYDIVSGGSAALLAGFLGFLICEKFGFELLDSGDFYFLFMYIVFLSFFFKLFTKLISFENNNWSVFGLKWAKYYFLTFFNFFKNFVK